MPGMEPTEHIKYLARDGRLLADSAAKAGTDAGVPTCPDWRVRDLLLHTGGVHRWATALVVEGHTTPPAPGAEPDLDGDALIEWFREGHGLLVAALSSAPDDLVCWTFMPAPTPLAFWARRQAHETAIHRVDAESALGASPAPMGAEFAVDGIDELLAGFHSGGRSKVRSDVPRVLRVRATDTEAEWTVRISGQPPHTERTEGTERAPADCELSGTAEQLQLTLWNRLPLDSVTLTGDPALARLWRETSAIVMS